MHHAPACPSECPPGAGEFSLRAGEPNDSFKKDEEVSRSAMARGGYLGMCACVFAEQSVGFHPYGQPVGWWASSRVSVTLMRTLCI